MEPDHTQQVEAEDAVDFLYKNGWGRLCHVLMHDDTIRFRSGKINMSRLSQRMNWTAKQTAYAMQRLRELLEEPCS